MECAEFAGASNLQRHTARALVDVYDISVDDRIRRRHGSINFDEGAFVGAFYDSGQRGEFANLHDCICKIIRNVAVDTVSITTLTIILWIIIVSVIVFF